MLDQIKVLNSAEAVVCVLSNTLPDACPIIDFIIDQEAIDGGAYSDLCTLKIPANHTDAQYITQGNYLLFKDNDGNWQEYKIVQALRHDSDASSTIEALGEHAFYELLGEPLDDIRPTTTTASLAVTQALADTRWELGTGADLGSHSCRIYKTSVLSGLQTIAEAWGGELFFKLEVTGSVITARKVDILATRGNATGKRFEFHKDLVDVVQTINMQNLATALIGRGKGVEVDGGTETEDPAYGRRLEFTDVVWTTAGGDPADKPADQNWIGDDTAKAAYGPGGRHIYGFVTFDDCTDAEELLQLTYDELQTRKAPETTYEMEAITLEEISGLEHEAVRFGDTVYVIDDAVTPIITGTARVFRIKRSYVDPADCKVILGNYIPSSTSNIANLLKYQKGMLDRSGTWDRANAITAYTGSAGTLEYAINLLKTQLSATTTHFSTDENGNYLWENDTQDEAVKIGAGIIALANTKTLGEYNWRTFLTGAGVTADEITAGTMSADRINGGTLTLGGAANGNGVAYIKDASNDNRIMIANDGFSFYDALGNVSVRLATTTADKTITVGSGKDFETIQEAFDSIPYFVEHNIIIKIDDGTYAEDAVINGRDGGGEILIMREGASEVTTNSFGFYNIRCNLYVLGEFILISTDATVDVNNCYNVTLEHITTTETSENIGVSIVRTKYAQIFTLTASNKSTAVFIISSMVNIASATGTGNTCAYSLSNTVMLGNLPAELSGSVSITNSLVIPDGGYFADISGWTPAIDTWTYVSATSFTVSGNQTAKYGKGDKLKWTQNGTVRHSNIIATPTYSAGTGLTTITIHAGYVTTSGDCAILDTATYAITANYYSKVENPQGWPDWFKWAGTYTGFSSAPTNINRFKITGRQVTLELRDSNAGTSDATTYSYTLPITAATITSMFWVGYCSCDDNGAVVTAVSRLRIASAGTVVSAYKDWDTGSTGGFTASGNKRVVFGNIFYEY